MATRTINSPGVEIKEHDLSLRTEVTTGTNFFVAGFSKQGPTDEIINPTDIEEFKDIFGEPTNSAERYFYHTVEETFNSPANLYVSRLPYGSDLGEGFGSEYSALVYPILPIPETASGDTVDASTILEYDKAEYYYIGKPTHATLTEDEYYRIKDGDFKWENSVPLSGPTFDDNDLSSLQSAGIIVLNDSKLSVNEKFEGYYIGLADNTTVLPGSPYDSIKSVFTIDSYLDNGFVSIPTSRMGFAVESVFDTEVGYRSNSISEIIEKIPSFEITGSSYDDTLVLGVFRLRTSQFGNTESSLEYVYREGFVGSFNSLRKIQDQNGGPLKTFYIEDIINDSSVDLKIHINPYISKRAYWSDENGDNSNPIRKIRVYRGTEDDESNLIVPTAHVDYFDIASDPSTGWLEPADSLFTHSVYSPSLPISTSTAIGNIPGKLNRVLAQIENKEEYPIDFTLDAGLSTIWAVTDTLSADNFDDESYLDLTGIETQTTEIVDNPIINCHRTVYDIFNNFTQYNRKDHVHFSDPLRNIFVQGANNKTLNKKSKNFTSNVYWPLRNLYQLANSSYSMTDANWYKVYDEFCDKNIWIPPSGVAAKLIAITDSQQAPWAAAAGFNRGIVSGVLDVAINPNQKQRDSLYKIGLNPVAYFPNDGIVRIGQKTLQRKPSAFDRLNVRRLFLVLERSTANVAKYFVMEPNTVFTRSRFVNSLTPIFELAKNTDGLYEYLLVCDERNNTPTVIDANEMKCAVYIKPTRLAEFVLVDFYATNSSVDFNELV